MDMSLVKLLFGAAHSNRVCVESTIFRLNSHLTAVSMLVALFVTTTTVFVTKPIYCDGNRDLSGILEMINAHCYLHGTYRYVFWYFLRNDPEAIAYRIKNSNASFQYLYPGIHPYPGIVRANFTEQNSELVLLRYTYFNWLFVAFFLIVSSS